MNVKQISELVNNTTKEISGEITLLAEDLSNVIEVGKSLENAGGLDNYVRTLPNMVGRLVFVNRKYSGGAPNILMEGWEFGSIMGKYRSKMPEATENESWELQDGASYDMTIFTKPYASAKFFNKKVTFEIPLSITEKQVKESFHSAQELNGFIEMIYNEVDKSMTVKLDSLIMRTINNFAAETIHNGVGSTYGSTSTRAVNLLRLYNDAFNSGSGATKLSAAKAIYDKEFIRFSVYTMSKYRDYMKRINTNFNIGGTEKFTPPEYLKTVLLSDFAKAAGVYLYDANGQFNTGNLSLGKFETVPFWQGSGKDFSFETLSEIKVTTSEGNSVDCTGILGVMFDRDACAVCNQDRRVTTAPYNAKGEFWNSWHKWDCEYINDFDENFVVFFIHDAA